MEQKLSIVKKYLSAGLSIIPADLHSKGPYKNLPWKKYTIELPDDAFAEKYFLNSGAQPALVCGKVSGMVEIIDVDNHFDDAGNMLEQFRDIIDSTSPGLWSKLTIESTQSGGYHIIYKVLAQIEGPQKLARRPKDNGGADVLIETRGEGSYALVAPSEGYNLMQGKISALPVLTIAERNLLLDTAQSFNEYESPDLYQNVKDVDVDDSEEGMPGTEFNDRGEIRSLLEANGWTLVRVFGGVEQWRRPGKNRGISATFNSNSLKNPNRFYVFSTSAAPFEDRHSYSKFAVKALLEHHGDFKECTKALIHQGFGKANGKHQAKAKLGSKLNGHSKKLSAALSSSAPLAVNDDGDLVDDPIEIPNLPANCLFWQETENANGKNETKLIINKAKFINFLEYYGFFKYWIDDNISIYVRERDHIISEETPETILDFMKEQIADLPFKISPNKTRYDLWETVLQKIAVVNSRDFLSTLTPKKIDFLTDTADTAHFCFKNGFVRINKESAALISYSELKEFIWKNQIIDHNIKLLSQDEGSDTSSCLFGKFLEKVCSLRSQEEPENREKRTIDAERLGSLLTGIGYLLHTYKDPAVTKAVIFCEERIAKEDESNGRTGKGLTANAIGKLRKRVMFNGKQIDFRDKFLFQKVKPDSQLLYFDDVKKNFDFESLFSILTEGITIERKGQHPIEIPFNQSPKILISTNAVLSNDADSHKARKFEIEFADYFTADYSPVDEFKTNFFEKGWKFDDPEWDRFYSFMIYTCQLFLQNGLVTYKQINLAERKLLAIVPEEFIDFSELYIDNILIGEKVFREDIYNNFIEKNKIYAPNGRYATSQKTTTKWFNLIIKIKAIDATAMRGTTRNDRRYYWQLRSLINKDF